MGTEVLRPQDCLIERIRVSPEVFNHHRRKHMNFNRSGNAKTNQRAGSRRSAIRPDQKKRFENGNRSEAAISRRSASLDDLRKNENNRKALMAGNIKVLRRGESLDNLTGGNHRHHRPGKSDADQIRMGGIKPHSLSPELFSDHPSDVYAGSTVTMSPSPRSLPLPSFFSKKPVSRISDESATRDLRRLLRLE